MTDSLDVVIVGGGIHGVGVAQAAAAAGYSVRLLERTSLAHGTSSRSSKLIHGGLRYLESGQFGLVRESLEERELMLRLAPGLVTLKPFFIPVYPQTRRRPWQLAIGLTAYAALAGFGRSARFGRLPRSQWQRLDGLDTGSLQCVYRYFDAQTDDARLTEAVMNSAISIGAELAMPAEFLCAHVGERDVHVGYRSGQRSLECTARVLVNAAGPWAMKVSGLVSPQPNTPPLELVQGTHIVVRGSVRRGIYYVESPSDGRAVFVMPWHSGVLVGTTETRFQGDPDRVRPLPAEINYLREVLRSYFPAFRPTGACEVIDAFAGLRVLPAAGGAAFNRRRETLLEFDDPRQPRYASIYGGKLTGWRATAERLVRQIAPSLPSRKVRADTHTLRVGPP